MRVFSPEIETLVEDLKETMLRYNGIGLAATQVGVLKRIVIVMVDESPQAFLNPRLTLKGEKSGGTEGCLSFPGYLAEIERYRRVIVSAKDETGKTIRLEAEGLVACALQHEVDHLDGILIKDRALEGSFRPATLQEQADLAALG